MVGCPIENGKEERGFPYRWCSKDDNCKAAKKDPEDEEGKEIGDVPEATSLRCWGGPTPCASDGRLSWLQVTDHGYEIPMSPRLSFVMHRLLDHLVGGCQQRFRDGAALPWSRCRAQLSANTA